MGISAFFRRLFGGKSSSPHQELIASIKAGLEDGSLNPMQVQGIISKANLADKKDDNPRLAALRQAMFDGYQPTQEFCKFVSAAQKNMFRNLKERIIAAQAQPAPNETEVAATPPQKAIRLVKTMERHVSKFGGQPNLPENVEWPLNPEGVELDFLAQIHCPELPPGFGLPTTGTLFFFYDWAEMPWGNDEKDKKYWKVIYSEAPLPETLRRRRSEREDYGEFKEVFLTFEVFESNVTDAENFGEENGHHQMLGYPLYIQEENMAPGKVLLLQIDTDEEDNGPCWMWGDCGRLFFWISPKDLASRRFDRIEFVLECC